MARGSYATLSEDSNLVLNLDTMRSEMSTSLQEAVHDHSGQEGAVDEHAGHDHSQGTSGDAEGAGGTTMGMKAVDVTDAEQKSNEN